MSDQTPPPSWFMDKNRAVTMVISVRVYQDETTDVNQRALGAALTQDEAGRDGTFEPAEKDTADGQVGVVARGADAEERDAPARLTSV